jgi:hypothetical protein
MPIDNPRYDVAISFLSKDEKTAAAIYLKLSEGLEVFFFPRNQEALAGTDGLESMRTPFFDDSRVMVVLYREPWGKTPWTGIEETAIKEACLAYGWSRLFFIVLDRESVIPVWLPQTHVRFNYADYGLEQAVGAIKARVQENGGQNLPLTPMKRAEIFKQEEQFRRDKLRMSSEEGLERIVKGVAELFRLIEKHCAEINAQRLLQIRCGHDFGELNQFQQCVLTDGRVGLTVVWYQQYSNSLAASSLTVREFSGGLILPAEASSRMYFDQPRQLRETKYKPDLSLAREYGWSQGDAPGFLTSSALAEQCVIRFMDIASQFARGEISK